MLAHGMLAVGFFVFSYYDYRANRDLAGFGLGYGTYLFDRSQFWPLVAIFDTLPMAILVGLFLALDWIGLAPPGLLVMTIVISSWRAIRYPGNREYILRNNAAAWGRLKAIADIPRAQARRQILSACNSE